MLSGCFSRLKSFGFKLLIAAFLVLSILLLIASVRVFSSYELLTIRLYLFFAVASLVPPFLVKKKLIKAEELLDEINAVKVERYRVDPRTEGTSSS